MPAAGWAGAPSPRHRSTRLTPSPAQSCGWPSDPAGRCSSAAPPSPPPSPPACPRHWSTRCSPCAGRGSRRCARTGRATRATSWTRPRPVQAEWAVAIAAGCGLTGHDVLGGAEEGAPRLVHDQRAAAAVADPGEGRDAGARAVRRRARHQHAGGIGVTLPGRLDLRRGGRARGHRSEGGGPGRRPVPDLLRPLFHVRPTAVHAVRDDAGPAVGMEAHGSPAARAVFQLASRSSGAAARSRSPASTAA